MKRTLTLAGIATLALSLGLAGPSTGAPKTLKAKSVAAKACSAEKRADRAAFNASYGANAMRDCIRANRSDARALIKNAADECRAERDLDPAAFTEAYGTNPNGANAFGKCVSSKVGDEIDESGEVFGNVADECRAERDLDPAAFTETYGTNPNGANAFGKCVNQKSGDVEEEEEVEEIDEEEVEL